MPLRRANRLEDEKWKGAYALLERAMELPAAERYAFSRQSTEDPDVLQLVLELLEGQNEAPPDAASPKLQSGDSFGRFVIGDLLGRGGMGEVYAARDTELNRAVAIKFASEQRLGGPRLAERVIGEARAASALNHPGIVTVYEVMRSNDSVAIVMERLEGVAFRKLCGKPTSVRQVAEWGSQIAGALAAAHAAGVVHRDVKPENLILRPDGYVKVLDFGLAQIVAEDDWAGIPMGTLGYMSPEQFGGGALSGASDVFSLGVVLTELLSARHPFLLETADLTHKAITTLSPGAYSDGGLPKIAEPLGSLLNAMLAKAPEQRPSAALVAKRLASIAHEPAGTWWRRNLPALVAVPGCLALAALLWRNNGTDPLTLKITPLTSYEGLEKNPTFSPDGSRIAFAWNGLDQTNWDIYVKSVGDDTPARLTSDPAEDFNPVWSPDGQRIAFLRKTADDRAPLILIVPAAGGPAQEVTHTAPFIQLLTHPIAWWPDGKSLIYRSGNAQQGLGLYRWFLDTGKQERLTSPGSLHTDSQPLPIDENRLALVRYEAGRRCSVCLALVGKETQCLEPAEPINGLVLAPDRKSLLYAAETAIWRVPLSGNRLGKPARILDGAFPDLTGDRDGKRFAFTKSYSDLNIWKIVTRSGQSTRLIASSAEDTNPDYSPDGSDIAFTSTRSGHSELYASHKDGSGVKQLTSLSGFVGSPQWSPDGKWIAFTGLTETTQHANIYLIAAGGGTPAPRRLTDDADPAMDAAWSRDGQWIYYSRGRVSFWKIPSKGGKPVPVANTGARTDARLAKDGRYLYYMGESPKGGIRRLDLGSSTETVVAWHGACGLPQLGIGLEWNLFR